MAHHLHLSKDSKLKKLVKEHGPLRLEKQKKIWLYLCYSIISQQLSVKVARVLRQRFLDIYGGNEPLPQQVVATSIEQLRAIGLSNSKANYVQNVARFELEKGMSPDRLSKMNNEEVIEYLTEIKGVGRWTAEMLLMFALGREDVFALDDLGIQQACARLYDLDNSDKKKFRAAMEKVSEKWAPYRTYACLYLWRWKDNPPPLKSAVNIKSAKKTNKPLPVKKKSKNQKKNT